VQEITGKKYLLPLTLTTLSVASFFLRFFSLQQTEFANGWDGYFYLVQLKSFFEEGSMHSSDYSLIYPLMFVIQWLTGDYVLTYKITSALLCALFTLAVSVFVLRYSKNKTLSLMAGAFTVFSPQLTFFVSQYPKNLLGVDMLILYMAFFRHRYKALPAGLFILNLFGHRVTFILSVVFTICMFLSQKHLKWLLYGFLGIVTLGTITVLIPGLINLHDFERFSGEFSLTPQFAPLSFINEFTNEKLTMLWKAEIMFAVLFYAFSVFLLVRMFLKKEHNRIHFSLIILFAILLFPFFRWSLEGFSFRMYLLFVIMVPLLFINLPGRLNTAFMVTIPSLLVLSFFSTQSYDPQKHDPPYAKYEVVAQKVSQSGFDIELIIGHKALAEYVTYSSGIDVMPWIPDYKIEKEKLWRIAADVRELELEYYIGEENMKYVKRLNMGYFLIREDLWQLFLKLVIEKDNDTELYNRVNTWKNPSEVRPYYLGKNR